MRISNSEKARRKVRATWEWKWEWDWKWDWKWEWDWEMRMRRKSKMRRKLKMKNEWECEYENVHQSDQSVHKKCQHQIKFDFATNRPADHQLAVSGNRCLDGLGLAKIWARKCKPLVSNGAHAQRIYNARRLCTTRFSAIMCDGAKLWRSRGAFVPLSETCFRSARFHAMSVMKPPQILPTYATAL